MGPFRKTVTIYGRCIVAGESYLEVMYVQQVASKIGKS